MIDRPRARALLLGVVAAMAALGAQAATASALTVDVTAAPYSAAGNGTTNDRVAIQSAIDDVSAAGGGTVVVPAGKTFRTGGVSIKDDVTLEIDGTLWQSQDDSNYAVAPTRGKFTASGIDNDNASFHNQPFVYAGNVNHAAVTGTGTVQMTTNGGDLDTTIYEIPIGFLNADNFTISGVKIRDSLVFNVAAYGSTHGTIEDLDIADTPINTDGISMVNSQYLHVTGNKLRVGDDGIYAVMRYDDPRDYNPASWYAQRRKQPTHDIEIDHNDVEAVSNPFVNGCCKAIMLGPRLSDATDLRDVAVTDVYIHDNRLHAVDAVGCWYGELAPMARIKIINNTYEGNTTAGTLPLCAVTDFENDFGATSSRVLRNGDFEHTGDAWWSPSGDAGAVTTGSTDLVSAARTASSAFTGYVGYIQNLSTPTELMEGIGLTAGNGLPATLTLPTPLDTLFPSTLPYRITADVVTSGNPVRLMAYDSCTNALLGTQTVSPTVKTSESLTFSLSTSCGLVRLGIDRGSSTTGWALIDNVKLDRGASAGQVIDDADPTTATYTGTWTPFTNSPTLDVDGTRHVGMTAGSTVTIPFTGTRAWVVSNTSNHLGKADVYVDGVLKTTIDYYSSTLVEPKVLYDTGALSAGSHTVKLVQTGTHNPSSTDILIGFDALLVQP